MWPDKSTRISIPSAGRFRNGLVGQTHDVTPDIAGAPDTIGHVIRTDVVCITEYFKAPPVVMLEEREEESTHGAAPEVRGDIADAQ